MGYAFISYSSKNQQMADSFRTLFNKNGIETWMAPGDIPFGSTYTSTINRAIKDSSCFVLLLSESAQGSTWVLKETERAVSTGKTIFTVLLDDVSMNDDFEFMLSTSQAVAIRRIDENDEKIKRLIIAIKTYVGEEIQTKQKLQNIETDNNIYFKENAVMNGSVLEHFKGRASTSVVIPEGVTVIGARAFAFYPGLKGITIPSTVKKIEEYAFTDCPNLRSITVSKDNPVFFSDGNCCIERATSRLVFGCCISLIPDGVVIIGENAFNGCKNLTSIKIPDSVSHIERSAFYGCTTLKSIALPDGVTDIGNFTFCECCSLVDLMIPASVTNISSTAFYECWGLESICVAHDNPVYHSDGNCCIETKTKRLVLGCQNSTIPGDTAYIGDDAFGGCTKLRNITIPGSVREIGYEAFCGCESLTMVKISDGVEKICPNSFLNCSSIKELFIPTSVSELENFAFSNCVGLRSLKVSPENITYRSEDDCCIRKKDNVLVLGCRHSIIPDGITEIGDDAFCGCSLLTDIYFPESITKIGENAFDGSGLTNVILPNHIEYIGAHAFHQCNDLTSVVIPIGVKYIGELAFAGFDYADEKRDIFCEASKKPGRWHREWTDEDSDVHWRDEWYYDEDGFPTVIDNDNHHLYKNREEIEVNDVDFNEPLFLCLQCPNCNTTVYIEPKKEQSIDENGIVHTFCPECGQDIEIGKAYTENI